MDIVLGTLLCDMSVFILYFTQAISGRPQTTLGTPVQLPSRYQSYASTYATTSKRRTSGSVGRTKTWSKDVVCIPNEDNSPLNTTTFPIPRGEAWGRLAMKGLVGKMRIVSTWSARQVGIGHTCDSFYD